MPSDDHKVEKHMTDMRSRATSAAVEKVVAGIDDPEVEARYPDRTHFIPADNPRHGEMATRALFSGDPVVLVYPDGRELLLTPEHARGVAALALLLLLVVSAFRHRKSEAKVV